jgi:hypothetical protein
LINTAKVTLQIREKIGQNSSLLVLEFAAIASSVLISVGLYLSSIKDIHLLNMTDLGLASVLPWSIYVSILFLCLGFILTLQQKTLREPLLFLHVCLLIMMLYGVTLPVEEAPRFNVTWRHAGLVDYVQRNEAIYPSSDAYLNWPGFFILSAFIAEVSGLKSILRLAPYASVFNNLLYLGALMMIFRSTTRNRRLAWLAIWLFYTTNWIAQDYFSPQGLNYFLYLTILGIILSWFQENPGTRFLEKLARVRFLKFLSIPTPTKKRIPKTPTTHPLALPLCLLVLIIFSVSSHQLTQFAILFCVTALTLFRFNSFRNLPFIIGIIIAIWMIFMAAAFLKGNLTSMLQDIGHIEEAFHQGVTKRLDGSAGHAFIVRFRMMFTLGVWGLAFLGIFFRFRNGFRRQNSFKILSDARFLLLAIAPFALIPLQFYGGEMMLRVYLFTLPFMTFFVASLIYAEPENDIPWKKALAAGLLSMVLIVGFFLARYGNEKIDQFTANEVEAVRYLYKHAPAGSLLAAPSPHYPAKFLGYEQYKLKFLSDQVLDNDIDAIVATMTAKKYPQSYFIVTRSQQSFFYIFYGYPVENWETFESALLDSGHFVTIYSNEDSKIFEYIENK